MRIGLEDDILVVGAAASDHRHGHDWFFLRDRDRAVGINIDLGAVRVTSSVFRSLSWVSSSDGMIADLLRLGQNAQHPPGDKDGQADYI